MIFSETDTTYDAAGDAILTTTYQRGTNAATSQTGPLSGLSSTYALASYTADWYDGLGRQTAEADFGTNNGTAPTRYDSAPVWNGTSGEWEQYNGTTMVPIAALVSGTAYDQFDDVTDTTDPAGHDTHTEYDAAGRQIAVIQNYTGTGQISLAHPDQNVTTVYDYGAAQQVSTVTVEQANIAGAGSCRANASGKIDGSNGYPGALYFMYHNGVADLTALDGSGKWYWWSGGNAEGTGVWYPFTPDSAAVVLCQAYYSETVNGDGLPPQQRLTVGGVPLGFAAGSVTITWAAEYPSPPDGGPLYDFSVSGTFLPSAIESQTTTYVYGTDSAWSGSGGPDVYRNDLVRAVIYPDSTNTFDPGQATTTLGGTDCVTYEYDRQGEMTQMTDQNGTTHAYAYDGVGRLLSDTASNPNGLNGPVASIDYAYKVCGKLLSVSSKDASGNILNQVQYGYDSDGILTTEYQEHAGAVNAATSLYVAYGHAGQDLGYEPTSLQYPTSGSASSRVLTYDYGDSTDPNGNLGRVGSIVDGSGTTADITPSITLATYSYLGLDTLAGEDYTEPQIELDYAGTSPGSYPGLDQYGQVVDQVWKEYGVTQPLDEYKYGYDAEGNVTYRQNVVSANQTTPVYLDEAYTYDGLGQLKSLSRGQLVDEVLTNPTFTQGWTPDGMGTWAGYQVGNGTSTTLAQTRTANSANELQAISGGWAQPSYDAAGNMTTTPQPGNETNGLTCTYDAWNRLVEVADSNGMDVKYAYDGLGRMITRSVSGGPTTDYYYAGQQLLESCDQVPASPENGSTHTTEQYVWSARSLDAPILRDRTIWTYNTGTSSWTSSSDRIYYLTDANDNVTALVSAAGSVVERYVYDAYGNVTVYSGDWSSVLGEGSAASAVNNTLLFTGQQQDPQTGLYYCRARWYNPSTGAWITRDPAQSDANLYRYVGDDPISLQDPTGLAVSGGGSSGGGPEWTAPGHSTAPAAPAAPTPGSCGSAAAGPAAAAMTGPSGAGAVVMHEVFRPQGFLQGILDRWLGRPPLSTGFGQALWWDGASNGPVADLGVARVLASTGAPAIFGAITLDDRYGGGVLTQSQARRAAELPKNPANSRRSGEGADEYIKRLITSSRNGTGRDLKEQAAWDEQGAAAWKAQHPPAICTAPGWTPGMTEEEEKEWLRRREEERGQLEDLLGGINDLLIDQWKAGEVPPEAIP